MFENINALSPAPVLNLDSYLALNTYAHEDKVRNDTLFLYAALAAFRATKAIVIALSLDGYKHLKNINELEHAIMDNYTHMLANEGLVSNVYINGQIDQKLADKAAQQFIVEHSQWFSEDDADPANGDSVALVFGKKLISDLLGKTI